ncbi:MAG: alanine/ornithine racemase family PLP-dependent enzyme [Bacillota bacterium]
MRRARVIIDLAKISHNSRIMVSKCAQAGMIVVGVVKAVSGSPEVATAMLDGGVQWLADSRIENLTRLRQAGLQQTLMLLRTPHLGEVEQVVATADISLNSELATIRALGETACRQGKVHQIVFMVDVGDLREGVMPDDVMPLVHEIALVPGTELVGLGTNVGCYGGLVPTPENTTIICDLAKEIREKIGLDLPYLSGGNTRTSILLDDGGMPPGLHHLRLGEGILLGNYTLDGRKIPGSYQDAFILQAPVIELKTKPSRPQGVIARDAFGQIPAYEDKGLRRRAIVAVGRQDLGAGWLIPLDQGVEILGASSDHLIVDICDAVHDIEVGSILSFRLDYGSLVGLMTSPYVDKVHLLSGIELSP